ncbi:ACP S-malonyltransferase [Paenibacillus macquariensis]|uniref:[acyl-carrier-protein] S-malonyltransferase n=1 Tax=Paenibacillus macquariensis TaxID=948756 RepID=A0ABY1K2L2_9BACL|nr:ACP S-malonyltransferase [Paenibacillus macquariensis]MEC0090203.1 ACP S-malonyltransferase [Paenibacillus macquariensis]OAB39576.1 malonyl CoA-acyl carrier protein transacylase [Paenibacillus macquariensis subsp. macquariensis]SIR17311.1 [acyl-carrier-protein] S-malonyltransferase [Paenibacillus macquariensis]
MSKVGLLFPGQGSQYIGMGKSLYEQYAVARETFEEANEVLEFNLSSLCFEGAMDELTMTFNAQPAILTASVAAFRVLLQELRLTPTFAAGHSLGEFSALTCTGAIKFEDALRIVRKRGLLMQDAVVSNEGAMLAIIGLSDLEVEAVCEEVSTGYGSMVVVANYNSHDQIVVSGHTAAVDIVKEKLSAKGVKTIALKVSAPFHTPLMYSAFAGLRDELESCSYGKFAYPVISNVTATPYSDSNYIVSNLTTQLFKPVQWHNSIQYMLNQGVHSFIEVGPKKVLKNLLTGYSKVHQSVSFEHPFEIGAIREAGIESHPDGMGLISKCIAVAVSTQNRNWDNEHYETGVVIPYNKLVDLRDQLIQSNTEPTIDQLQFALDMLRSILETKLTTKELQRERFNQILTNTCTHELFPLFEVS